MAVHHPRLQRLYRALQLMRATSHRDDHAMEQARLTMEHEKERAGHSGATAGEILELIHDRHPAWSKPDDA